MFKRLLLLIALLLLCASANAQEHFNGSLFDETTPAPSPTPVEIASRSQRAFVAALLQSGGSASSPYADYFRPKSTQPVACGSGQQGRVWFDSSVAKTFKGCNGTAWQAFVTSGATLPATATQGDLLYGSAANVYSNLAKNTSATRYLSNTGTSNNPAWAQVDLSNGVTGDLPFANLTQGSALSVLGVTGNATADFASIAAGTDNQVLRRSGTSLAFGAVNLASSNAVTGALLAANGGTGLSALGSALQQLRVNAGATALEYFTASSGITNSAASGVVPVTIDGSGNLGASRLVDGGTSLDVNNAGGNIFNISYNNLNPSFKAGDVAGNGNATRIVLTDSAKSIFIQALGQAYFGDADGLVNLTYLYVDDTDKEIEANTSGTFKAGDAQAGGNSTLFTINDTAKTLTSAASTESLTIDGTAHTASIAAATSIGLAAPTVKVSGTVTAGGTTGAQTINKSAGSVNFAAAATSLVVTNSTVTTSSIIICTVATNDATLKSVQCVAGTGSFTMFGNAAAAAETRVNFWVITPQ